MLTVYYMICKEEKINVILYPQFIHSSTFFEESMIASDHGQNNDYISPSFYSDA